MKTSALRILALVSIGMLLLALWEPWHIPTKARLQRILDVATVADLSHITIGHNSQVYEVQRDASKQWLMPRAQPARARPEVVRKLIGALALLHPVRESKLAAQHGIAENSSWIRFQAGVGVPGLLRIGALTADEQHRWVQLNNGKALLVESHLIEEVLDAAQALESKRLLARRATNLDALKIVGGQSWMEVQNGMLSFAQGGHVAVDTSRYAEFRDRLWALEFLGPEPSEASCEGTKPALSYTLNGALTQIFECGACSGEAVVLAVALRVDSSIGTTTGCVPKQAWQSIVHSIEKPLALASLLLLPTRRAQDSFTIRCRGAAVVVDASVADERRLQQWWQAVDMGAVAVEVHVPSEVMCRIDSDSWQLHTGTKGEHWYAWYPGSRISYRLGGEASRAIQNARASRFRTLQLISEEPILASQIQVKEGQKSYTLKRGEQLGVWSSSQTATSQDEATSFATSLLIEVAKLRAIDFVKEPGNAGRATRQLQIEFAVLGTGETKRYQLSVWHMSGSHECLVQVDEQPLAMLSPQSCEALLNS